MDSKTLKGIIQKNSQDLSLRKNLHSRSIGESASSFEWSNHENADGVPILARTKVSDGDPNVKTAFDNFSQIQITKSGYLSDIVRRYSDDIQDSVKDRYVEFDKINQTEAMYSDMMQSCTGWGKTYTLCFLDDDNNVRIKELTAWSTIVLEDQAIVIEELHKKVKIWLYTATDVETFSGSTKDSIESNNDIRPHGFTHLPVIEWKNNNSCRGNAQKAVGLMDAYDRITSDGVTESTAFANAYLILKNMGVIDEERREAIQKTGVIIADGENATAEFLTKDINPEFVALIMAEVWSGIWIVASSVDPKALSQLSNATAFQISQLYRLVEMDAKETEKSWSKSFIKLDMLLEAFWTTMATPTVPSYSAFDINYDFKRNLPKDDISTLEAAERAGVEIPQWFRIMKAFGVDEKRARELAEEGMQEASAMIPEAFGDE